MKQRMTPPVSRTFLTKSTFVAAAVMMVGAAPFTALSTTRVYADQFDDQKTALQNQISQFEREAGSFSDQLTSLDAQLKRIESEKNQLKLQIALTQATYDQLQAQITATEAKIQQNRDALGIVITQLYMQDKVTPLEMLASSRNVGDYLNQQTYRLSMQKSLDTTIKQIGSLKVQLQKKQVAVKTTLDRQNAQQNDLVARESEQVALINKTRGQQALYLQLVDATKTQLSDMSKRQQDYFNQTGSMTGGGAYGVHGDFTYSNWSGNNGCGGGYPYCAAQDTMVDPWGLYNRECVSYVAWAMQNRFGKYVGNFNGQGNAGEWPGSAPRFSSAKIVTDPQPGDAVILPATSDNFAPIGHAMLVESVKDGTIHVSQYNFYGTGQYSTMDITQDGVVFLRFPSGK